MDKISVIMPFYNSEDTLRRCMESVLEQSYVNFELLCISDGSTDSSEEIVSKYALMDSRVKLIKIPHSGVSAARNAGLELADGDFIEFIDSDDYIEPDMMEKMLSAIKESGADISVCAFTHPSLQNYSGDRIYDMSKTEDILSLYKNAFAVVVPWNKLFKKETVTARFIEGIAFCEDEMFCDEVMLNAKKIVSISDKLYHYYVAPKGGKTSAITGMVASRFWESENTIFQMRKRLYGVTEKVFGGRVSADCAEELNYNRIFDFTLWGMSIYIASEADEDGTASEIARSINDTAFKKSIAVKEKYGISMIKATENENARKAKKLVSFCFDYYARFGDGGVKYRPYEIYLAAFAKLFISPKKGVIADASDPLAAAVLSLENNSTPEAQYVNLAFAETMTA
ncbi:MAG: glycosyltransferase family 2 protein [Acutalibacteraceae bacterium]